MGMGGALWSGRVEQRECKGKEGAWWMAGEGGESDKCDKVMI